MLFNIFLSCYRNKCIEFLFVVFFGSLKNISRNLFLCFFIVVDWNVFFFGFISFFLVENNSGVTFYFFSFHLFLFLFFAVVLVILNFVAFQYLHCMLFHLKKNCRKPFLLLWPWCHTFRFVFFASRQPTVSVCNCICNDSSSVGPKLSVLLWMFCSIRPHGYVARSELSTTHFVSGERKCCKELKLFDYALSLFRSQFSYNFSSSYYNFTTIIANWLSLFFSVPWDSCHSLSCNMCWAL